MSRFKNIITRSVGFEEDVAVDTMVVPIQPGDIYLLCSDGLANLASDVEMRDIAYENFLRDVPQRLIDLANDRDHLRDRSISEEHLLENSHKRYLASQHHSLSSLDHHYTKDRYRLAG